MILLKYVDSELELKAKDELNYRLAELRREESYETEIL